ncbi:MAG: hypothetical protein JW786_07345 [Desulfobacterales bacterium]|nr:hypothetical protein [Desulfobacterales bacterium]
MEEPIVEKTDQTIKTEKIVESAPKAKKEVASTEKEAKIEVEPPAETTSKPIAATEPDSEKESPKTIPPAKKEVKPRKEDVKTSESPKQEVKDRQEAEQGLSSAIDEIKPQKKDIKKDIKNSGSTCVSSLKEKASKSKLEMPYDTFCEMKGSDSMGKPMKYSIAAFMIIAVLIIGASLANMGDYYIKAKDGSIEIWRGKFSPMSKELLMTLPGVEIQEPIKAVYSKEEITPFAFKYYIEKADALLDEPGIPDFEKIESYLREALSYSDVGGPLNPANLRLASLQLMGFLYKADLAANKGTLADLETAMGYLEEAALLHVDEKQAELVIRKVETIDKLIEAFKSQEGHGPITTTHAE